jgi:hypothetical protein
VTRCDSGWIISCCDRGNQALLVVGGGGAEFLGGGGLLVHVEMCGAGFRVHGAG